MKTNPTLSALALKSSLAVAALALLMATSTAHAGGRNPNPGVLPPNSTAYGYSLGDWGGLWWRWAFSIPPDQHPAADPTGELAAVDQSGPVWFLAGTFGGSAERTIEVPTGKALLLPLLNRSWVTTCVGEPRTIDGIRELMLPFGADELVCEIDGVPLQGLDQYLVESRLFCTELDLIGVTTPEDLADTCPGGTSNPNCLDLPNPEEHYGPDDGFGPGMAIGYYVLIAPLHKGVHTIYAKGVNGDFTSEVTYHITVD